MKDDERQKVLEFCFVNDVTNLQEIKMMEASLWVQNRDMSVIRPIVFHLSHTKY